MDDITNIKDASEAIMYWYLMRKEKRTEYGLKGREWAMGLGGINAKNMCSQFITAMDYVFDNWKPVKQFGLYSEKDYVGNLMPGGMGFEIPQFNQEQIKQKIQQDDG